MAKLLIDKNRQSIPPTILLKRRNLETIGIIPYVSDVNLSVNFSSADEISFTVYKYIDGETNPLWDEIESLKIVYLQEQDENFEISVNVIDNESTIKKVTGTSLCEAELSNVMLYDIEINTKEDSDNEDFTKASVFCDFTDTKHSIVHRILEKVPHYNIGHVDESLANMVREFSINGTSIHSFLIGEFSEQFGCICLFDSNTRTINFYDLENRCTNPACTSRTKKIGTSTYCPYCGSTDIVYGYGKDTTIFVTNENIAQEISMESQTDSLKNCFRVSGGDDDMTAAFMNINPNGSQYIYYFNDSQLNDMPDELRDKLIEYQELYQEYITIHEYLVNTDNANTKRTNYNALLEKYHPDDYSEYLVPEVINGYDDLTNHLYNISDMSIYLKSTYMPEISYTATTAAEEINKLTPSTLGSIGVENLNKIIVTSLSRSILDYAKIFINTGKYKLTLDDSNSNYPKVENNKWIGAFVCKSRTDELDTATSPLITLQLTNDQTQFLKQKIQKQLEEYNIKETDSEPDNPTYWTKYCLDSLEGYKLAYEGVVGILQTSVNSIADSVKTEFLTKYSNRLTEINKEIIVRTNELSVIDSINEILYEYRINTHEALNFQNYIGNDLLKVFYSYRREQDYKNSTYISDGYSSNQIIDSARKLFDESRRNLIKAATLQHSISVTMNDLLTIPEFEPLWGDFEAGNWIRVRVNDEVIRLRLVKYDIKFEDISSLTVEFSDIIASPSSTSNIQSILSKAQSINSKFDYVEQQASSMYKNKNYFDDWFINGLDASKTRIVDSAKNQNIVFDANGILCREYYPYDEVYDPCQMRIINQGLYLTDNNWSSLVTAIGKFIYQDKDGNQITTYGVNGQTIVGKLLIGENLEINNQNNNLSINEDGFQISNTISKIILDPNAENGNIFQVLKNGEAQLYIDQNGNIKINGAIIDLSGAYVPTIEGGETVNYVFKDYIEAKTISVVNLDANVANLINATIENATVKSLNGKYANITYIDNNFLKTDELVVKIAEIDTLDANCAFIIDLKTKVIDAEVIKSIVADFGYLTADSAVITELKGNYANINTILAGNIGTGTLQTIVLTANNTTISTSFIEDLLANHITAKAIFGNKISTNDFSIESDSGNLRIKDSTISIKDKNEKTRIQIGEDADGNFSFLVLDENGTGTIINQNGITEKAIANELLKSDMFASKNDTYKGIDQTKINIDSVVTKINEDGNLEISANKVYYDEEKNSIKTVMQTMESKLIYEVAIMSSNGTMIKDTTTLTAKVYNYGTTDEATGDFTYQWYKNGTEITGATNKTLEINLGSDDVAQYTCKVSY